MANQAAHASMAPIATQLRQSEESGLKWSLDETTRQWIDETFTKITLGVNNERQLREVMENLDSDGIVYSRTEESSKGRELTAIGTKPYDKCEISKYFAGLKLLR